MQNSYLKTSASWLHGSHFVENGYPSLWFPNVVKVNIHEHWTQVTRFNPLWVSDISCLAVMWCVPWTSIVIWLQRRDLNLFNTFFPGSCDHSGENNYIIYLAWPLNHTTASFFLNLNSKVKNKGSYLQRKMS